MQPTLSLHPIHASSAEILKCFATGKPLSAEQINFLDWHAKELSNENYDPIVRYYLDSEKRKTKKTSFLLRYEIINSDAINDLKLRILASLNDKNDHVEIQLTEQQFMQFKQNAGYDLLYWHGNQFITGPYLYPTRIPPMIYLSWGNFFCVIRYVALAIGKQLKPQMILYIEKKLDRTLDQCVLEYNDKIQHAIQLQKEITTQHQLTETHEPSIKIPRLALTQYYLLDHHS